MVLFSVIIPIYNTPEEYLRKCINSCTCQGTDDLEVLLMDDGSEKYCMDICTEFTEKYPFISYHRQENRGVSVARNAGLSWSVGEYIVFLDADDWLPDGFLSKIKDMIPEDRPDMLLYGYSSEYSNKHFERIPSFGVRNPQNGRRFIDSILGRNNDFASYDVGTIWAKLIKRDLIADNGIRFIEGVKKGQDTVFMLYCYNHCSSIRCAGMIGYHYRKNNGSVTHKFNPDIVNINENLIRRYDEFLEYSGRTEEKKAVLAGIRFRMLVGEYMALYFCHRDNPRSRSDLQKEYLELISKDPYKDAVSFAEASGLYQKINLKALKKGRIKRVFLYRRIKDLLSRFVIREYD